MACYDRTLHRRQTFPLLHELVPTRASSATWAARARLRPAERSAVLGRGQNTRYFGLAVNRST